MVTHDVCFKSEIRLRRSLRDYVQGMTLHNPIFLRSALLQVQFYRAILRIRREIYSHNISLKQYFCITREFLLAPFGLLLLVQDFQNITWLSYCLKGLQNHQNKVRPLLCHIRPKLYLQVKFSALLTGCCNNVVVSVFDTRKASRFGFVVIDIHHNKYSYFVFHIRRFYLIWAVTTSA